FQNFRPTGGAARRDEQRDTAADGQAADLHARGDALAAAAVDDGAGNGAARIDDLAAFQNFRPTGGAARRNEQHDPAANGQAADLHARCDARAAAAADHRAGNSAARIDDLTAFENLGTDRCPAGRDDQGDAAAD